MHLVWGADLDDPTVYTRAAIDNLKSFVGLELSACLPLNGRLPLIRLNVVSDYAPADWFWVGPLFIVSDKLRAILESNNVDAEYHEVALLRDRSELECGQFYFANLLNKIDCLDVEKAIFTMDGDFIDTIQKLAIDDKKAGTNPLFRLAKAFDVITLVSENLASQIVNSGITAVLQEL